MRIIVIFDLPTGTGEERKAAANFRKSLIKDGFFMLQYSIYVRLCNGHNDVKKHMSRVSRNLPEKGSVRALVLTEQQYSEIKILLGVPTEIEKAHKNDQIIVF